MLIVPRTRRERIKRWEMRMEKEMKLAVLIDAENIAGKYIGVILSEANALGNVVYKRIYGNWTSTQMGAWRDIVLDNSIQPIQQYNNANGKNSSDSSLIIDAMDLLYTGRLNGFCIVSSDSDFTRLASRLRESEMYVLGMGEQKTPRSFISACHKFAYLDLLYKNSKSTAAVKHQQADAAKRANGAEERAAASGRTAAVKTAQRTEELSAPAPKEEAGAPVSKEEIIASLSQYAEEMSDDDGWIHAAKMADQLGKKFPDFDARNYGQRTFVPFVKSLGLFEMKRDKTNSTVVYFKLKQSGA